MPPISRFGSRHQGRLDFQFTPDGRMHYDRNSTAAFAFTEVPSDHEALRALVESWTGIALIDQDVRLLGEIDWTERLEQLRTAEPDFATPE